MSPSYLYKSPSGFDWADCEDDFNVNAAPVQSPEYMYTSKTGRNWSDDEEDLLPEVNQVAKVSATPTAPNIYKLQQTVPGTEEFDNEDAECSEHISPKVAEACVHFDIRPNYAVAVQETWGNHAYIARPAYTEMSCDGLYVYPEKRTNYSANWLQHKAEQGANMKVPLKIRPSPLSLWSLDSKGDYVVENGIMTSEQLPEPSVNNDHLETKEQDTFEPTESFTAGGDQAYDYNDIDAVVDIPPSDDDIEVDTDLSPARYRSLMSDLGSENPFDEASSGDEFGEFDSELGSEPGSEEQTDEEDQRKCTPEIAAKTFSNQTIDALASPISSATSIHGDVTKAELDEDNAVPTSSADDEDHCKILDDLTPFETQQSSMHTEDMGAAVSPIPDLTDTSTVSSSSTDPVGSELADLESNAAVDSVDISKDIGLVLAATHSCSLSSEEVQAGPSPSTVPVEVNSTPSAVSNDVAQSNYASYNQSEQHKEEDMAEFEDVESLSMDIDHVTGPVQGDDVFSPSTESLPSGEQAYYTQSERCNEESCTVTEECTPVIEESCPTPVPVGDAVLLIDATVPVCTQLVDYSETKRNAEEEHMSEQSTSIAIPIPIIRKANVSAGPTMASRNAHPAPHTRLGRTHTFASLVLNTVTTGCFAVSSIPWTRISVAAVGMGIMYNVATRILRR